MLNKLFQFITSLKLTVVCLAFSMLIVFVGTLAQVNQGLYLVQERYFKSIFVFWGPENAEWQIPVMPGGYLIGVLLMVNLAAAFFKRFKLTKKKLGIYLTHVGLVLLLLGQVFTDFLSRESAMQIEEGATSSHSEDFRLNELVLTDHSSQTEDKIYAVSESYLQSKDGAVIADGTLPFKIKVHGFWSNVSLTSRRVDDQGNEKPGYTKVEATTGFPEVYMKPIPPETAMEKRDIVTADLELLDGDTSIGRWLVATVVLEPQTFQHQGRSYSIAMRPKRYYEGFSLTLLKATHENYTGTNEPKNFASRIRLMNDESGEDREVLIYMNHPLRYQGLTFFQHQMTAGELAMREGLTPSSTFQVVKNPTWVTPYLACTLVGLGLTLQFMIHLVGFTRSRSKTKPA